MVTARRRSGGPRRTGWGANLLGLIGLVCLLVAGGGLARSTGLLTGGGSSSGSSPSLRSARPAARSYYPLDVGRYWIYVSRDSVRGVLTEVERRIVRREAGPDHDVYYFADGGLAFRRDGMVCEIGPEGGLNVVPVDTTVAAVQPYPYASRGLHIEKSVGVQDTALVVEGKTYSGCVQVITRFRRLEDDQVAAYASYYARGVGLVARHPWPAADGTAMEVALKAYGPGVQ